MGLATSGSTKKRRQKRAKILKALELLGNQTAVVRVQTMNRQFGPYWYYLLPLDEKIPEELKHNGRYLDWLNEINPSMLRFF